MILILYLTLMYKTMGGGSWNGSLVSPSVSTVHTHVSIEPSSFEGEDISDSNEKSEEIEEAVQVITGQFSLAWQSLKHVGFYKFYRSISVRMRDRAGFKPAHVHFY